MRVSACLALFLAFGALAVAQSPLPVKYKAPAPKPADKVASVNGKAITAAEVESMLWQWYGRQSVQDVMSYVLINREAADRGLVVADSEVEKAVDEQILSLQKSQGQTPEQAKKWLDDQGFTRSRLFLRLKAKLLLDKVLLSEFHPENYVKVSTILVRTASSDAGAISAAIAKAQEAYDKLMKGEDWDSVLKAATTEEKALQVHGVLGWREIGAFPETVQKEMTGLKPGGFTKPAQTSSGIQVFRIDAWGSEAKGAALDELRNMYLEVNRPQFVTAIQGKMKLLLPNPK